MRYNSVWVLKNKYALWDAWDLGVFHMYIIIIVIQNWYVSMIKINKLQ